MGGPIVRNRAWFFGAYQPALTDNERTVDSVDRGEPRRRHVRRGPEGERAVPEREHDRAVQRQPARPLRVQQQLGEDDRSPAGPGRHRADWNQLRPDQAFPNYTLSGNLDWVASPKLFFGIRGGYYFSDVNDTNVTEQPRYVFQTGNNLAIPGVPDATSASRPGSRRSRPPRSSSTRAISRRVPTSRPTAPCTAALAGQHQVKFGMQADRLGNDVLTGESRNRVLIHWDTHARFRTIRPRAAPTATTRCAATA